MDRDNRWDRVEKAYNALTKGEGETGSIRACEAVAGIPMMKGVTDEFVLPTVVTRRTARRWQRFRMEIL